MAVLPVKVVSIIGISSALDDVVKVCGKSQIFHPDDALSFYSKTENFVPFTGKNEFEEPLRRLQSMADSIGKNLHFVDTPGFDANYTEVCEYVDYMSQKLERLVVEKKEAIAKIEQYNQTMEQIRPFIGLNINLEEISKCNYIRARFGKLPKESYLRLCSYEDNPYVLFFPCTSDKNFFWGVYFTPIEYKDEVDRIFAGLYFERMTVSEHDGTPESKLENIKEKIAYQEKNIDEIDKKIESLWKTQKDQVMRFYTKLEELSTYGKIKRYASKYHENFILVGWIPEENELSFSQALDSIYGIEYSIDKADMEKKHTPPVKLKNNWFAKPFESFVKMYGLPCYKEIDPTLFVAITYTLMYGIMFGDLGHGVLLALVGELLWRLRRFSLGKVMVRCGISSAIFGVGYGSVFGYEHILDPLYKNIFGLHEKPLDVMESGNIMKIIAATVALGAVLIVLAMVLKICSAIKAKDMGEALFSQSGLAGLVFYVSLILGVVCQMLLGIKVFSLVYVLCLLVLPMVLIFLKEPLSRVLEGDTTWRPDSVAEYILQNFFEMFTMLLEYATNTISFLRIGAYVLVHAGLMMAVFIISNMLPAGANIAVIVVGNLAVVAMEGLLVGIQVLRLEFYEMFSRFFDGEGHAFEPVVVHRDSLFKSRISD